MNKIVAKEQFSEKVYKLVVEAPLIAKARRAGHFVIVRVGEKGERMPLTIADADTQAGTITLVVQKVGVSSTKLCNLNVKFAGTQPTVTTAPKAEPAVTTAPKTEPAPERTTRKPTGLSLKSMMADAEQKPAVESAPAAAAETPVPAEKPSLEEAWKAMAESESKAPRLSYTLAQAVPVLTGNEIHFEVGNIAAQDWINRNCRARLEAFLQRKLTDPDLRLIVDVKQAEETNRGMYMPSDKAKYLQENSPEYNALRKDFELEIS